MSKEQKTVEEMKEICEALKAKQESSNFKINRLLDDYKSLNTKYTCLYIDFSEMRKKKNTLLRLCLCFGSLFFFTLSLFIYACQYS